MARNDEFEIEEDDDGNKIVVLPADQATNLRNLARTAETNANAAAERDAAQRELAFFRAGINAESAVGQLFVKGYDGELTTEAIKAAAAEIPGLVGEATPPPVTEPTAEEAEAARLEAEQTAARQNLARGSAGDVPPPDKSGVEAANDIVTQVRSEGRRDEVAQGMGVAALASAALKGDKSVLVPQRGPAPE